MLITHRLANVLNNTTISNTFSSNNNNVAYIKTEHRQIMVTISYRILKFEPMIKEAIVTNQAFFTAITVSKINSFTYIDSIVIQHL